MSASKHLDYSNDFVFASDTSSSLPMQRCSIMRDAENCPSRCLLEADNLKTGRSVVRHVTGVLGPKSDPDAITNPVEAQ